MAEGAGNFHHVLLGDGKLLERRFGAEIGLDPLEQIRATAPHFAPVDETAARHVAHEYILGHGKLVEHHGFLMNRGNAGGPGFTW